MHYKSILKIILFLLLGISWSFAQSSENSLKIEITASQENTLGLIKGPNEKYAVYVFNDDASGFTIGIMNLNDGKAFSTHKGSKQGNLWGTSRRFWQEEKWCRDVYSIEWSKDGLTLIICTNYIYGTSTQYTLDLRHKKILSEVPLP